MSSLDDPLSLVSQLLREIRPSTMDLARERERRRQREWRQSAEYKRKNRQRMKKLRKEA
jgi:hypothetical protein